MTTLHIHTNHFILAADLKLAIVCSKQDQFPPISQSGCPPISTSIYSTVNAFNKQKLT